MNNHITIQSRIASNNTVFYPDACSILNSAVFYHYVTLIMFRVKFYLRSFLLSQQFDLFQTSMMSTEHLN